LTLEEETETVQAKLNLVKHYIVGTEPPLHRCCPLQMNGLPLPYLSFLTFKLSNWGITGR